MTKRLCNSKLCSRPFAWQVALAPLPLSQPRDRARDSVPPLEAVAPHNQDPAVSQRQNLVASILFSLTNLFTDFPISCTLLLQSNPRDRKHPFNIRPLSHRQHDVSQSLPHPFLDSLQPSIPSTKPSAQPRCTRDTRVLPVPSAPTSPLNRLFVSPTSATLAAYTQNGAHETQQ